MPSRIVLIEALTKIYESRQRVVAVDGIDLSVPAGGIFGLLGPNGAGKTTTISICTTRSLPTSGQVIIAGCDVVAKPAVARRQIGVVPQFNTLDRSLTAFENLFFHCRYFGMSDSRAKQRAEQLLTQFRLADRAKSFPNELSGGLAQRLLVARAIAHQPAVLFLDEPSAGLDPQSRLAMWESIRSLKDQGITVLMTTHYMEEAEALCDRVAIIDHGKILVEDTPEKLKNGLGIQTVYGLDIQHVDQREELANKLRTVSDVTSVETTSTGVRVYTQGAEGLLSTIVTEAQAYGLRDISISEPSLETVFIHLTGRELRE
ncbi:MAG TPA: ATP-binding cassette domain-containing protein [Acidobacteriaceae bacterium]|nr:ATP-binding cassette domain-containing protein [Acidobacteriaceae bacterium]